MNKEEYVNVDRIVCGFEQVLRKNHLLQKR